MGYIDSEGNYKRYETSPVKNAYWKICECAVCLDERTVFIARGAAEDLLKHQAEKAKDIITSEMYE